MTRTPKAGFLFIAILNKMRVVKNEIVFSGEDGKPITTSLVIADIFGKEHNKVCKDIENLSCSDSFRVANFGEATFKNSKTNQFHKMYTMTKDGFTFLVMGYTGKKAGEFKEKFINRFNEMEKEIQSARNGLPDFSNPAEAARVWAQQYEERKELEYKNAQLEQEHHENQPKVEFANSVMQSTDCIGIGEMAQILKQNKLSRMGQNRFYEWLRYNGFLLQRGSRRNLPAQKSINLGIMKIAESVCDSRMGVIINRKAVITPQGQAYFVDYFRKLSNNGYKLFL